VKKLVGDYEHDSDAAYRASQVLDHIEKFDSGGNRNSGKDVGNGRIDGITDSGEVRHGTEAGRLKDLGKYGFESLKGDLKKTSAEWGDPKAREQAARLGINWVHPQGDKRSAREIIDDSPLLKNLGNQNGVKDRLKERVGDFDRDADAAFRAVQVLEHIEKYNENGKSISGGDIGNGKIDGFTKGGEAKHGTEAGRLQDFGKYGFDNLKRELPRRPDPKHDEAARKEAEALGIKWERPKGDERSAKEIVDDNPLLKNLGNQGHVKDMLKERVDDFDRDADAAFRAAQVLRHIEKFDGNGNIQDGKKKLSDRAGVGGDPAAVMAEIKQRIDILKKDPEVVKFLNETGEKTLKDFVGSDKDLKNALTGIYDKDIKSGAALDKSWKPGAGPTENLANFFQTGKMYQAALGLDNAKALQDAVKNSKHNGELQDFYEKKMVSGDRFKDLLKDHTPEEAISTFSLEVGLYNAALDPDFTGKHDKKLNENFTSIAKDGAFNGATAQDLQKAFGINGGKDLDEKKVREMIDEIGKTNPELLVNQDGTKAKPDQILTAFRGQWEALRQGTKGGGAYGLIDANNSAKRLFDKGIQHGVSGLLLAGITIAKGIGGSGHLTDRNKVDIAIGSFQTAAILAEGGVKNYRDFLKKAGFDPKTIGDPKSFNEFLQKNASRFEFGLRGVGGGLAGLALGAYNIFDGVKAIRNGDVATGAVNITTGSLGLLGASAVTVEGGMGALGYVVPRLIQGLGAGFGVAGGVLSLASTFILTAINESKASSLQNDYADLLGDYLKKYNIDGKPGDKA
jgi:hypothetical protein